MISFFFAPSVRMCVYRIFSLSATKPSYFYTFNVLIFVGSSSVVAIDIVKCQTINIWRNEFMSSTKLLGFSWMLQFYDVFRVQYITQAFSLAVSQKRICNISTRKFPVSNYLRARSGYKQILYLQFSVFFSSAKRAYDYTIKFICNLHNNF